MHLTTSIVDVSSRAGLLHDSPFICALPGDPLGSGSKGKSAPSSLVAPLDSVNVGGEGEGEGEGVRIN